MDGTHTVGFEYGPSRRPRDTVKSDNKLKRVTSAEAADGDSIIVTLYPCRSNRVRGWFVGPISMLRSRVSVPYIAPSRKMFGKVAVVRARRMAEQRGLSIGIVDPDDL